MPSADTEMTRVAAVTVSGDPRSASSVRQASSMHPDPASAATPAPAMGSQFIWLSAACVSGHWLTSP